MSQLNSSAASSIAVVTGATGYAAGHIVDQLTRKGYTVRGTVRSLTDPKSSQLQADFPKLQLYEADLLKDGSFNDAIAGARFVFHVASPFVRMAADPQREIIDPAVNGTANVVSAALCTPSVERIVLTSSTATGMSMGKPLGHRYTEADWNDQWPIKVAPYQLSKVLAERKAWELVDAHNNIARQTHPMRLITILAAPILGPPIGRRVDGMSVNTLTGLLDGSQVDAGVPPLNLTDVDVRDVAYAHVAAAEVPTAAGRYIVSRPTPSTRLDYVHIMQPLFPGRTLPSKAAAPWMFKDHTVDNSRSINELGVSYTEQDKTVQDMVAKLIDIGLIKKD